MDPAFAELLQRIAKLEQRLEPNRLRQSQEYAWDPRGGEPRVIGPDGRVLPYQGAIQFTSGSVREDPAGKRIIVAGGGGHAILRFPELTPMTQRSNLLVYSGDHDVLYEDYPSLDLTAMQIKAKAGGANARPSTVIDVYNGNDPATPPGLYQYDSPPDAVMQDILIIQAGGGGGGGIGPDPNTHGGGGGGGGAYRRFIHQLGPGGFMEVLLGSPGAAGGPGQPGEDATISRVGGITWQGLVAAKGGGAGSTSGPGAGGDGAVDPAGANGARGGNGGTATTSTLADGQVGNDGSGGGAGGGAGSSVFGLAGPQDIRGGRARGDAVGWLGGDGGMSHRPTVDPGTSAFYATGQPWGGGGAAGRIGTSIAPQASGPGGPALIVIVTHCLSPAT